MIAKRPRQGDAMRALARRLHRLEELAGVSGVPRQRMRFVISTVCELLEARERRAGWPPFEEVRPAGLHYGRQAIIEVLNAGRQREQW
jgi:hypothetical protein